MNVLEIWPYNLCVCVCVCVCGEGGGPTMYNGWSTYGPTYHTFHFRPQQLVIKLIKVS